MSIETMYDRIRRLREEQGMSQDDLAKKCGYSDRSTISKIEKGERNLPGSKIKIIADALGVKPSFLMDGDNDNSLNTPTISNDNIEFAVIGDVAAGFDKVAIEDWSGDKILIPSSYLKGRNKDDFFVLRVKGNSMYPEYREGDKLLILKQNAIDYSGQIAVAIYDDDLGTIKKIEYRKDSVCLLPINPQYQPEVIKGTDIEKVHILGIPKLLIRELDNE